MKHNHGGLEDHFLSNCVIYRSHVNLRCSIHREAYSLVWVCCDFIFGRRKKDMLPPLKVSVSAILQPILKSLPWNGTTRRKLTWQRKNQPFESFESLYLLLKMEVFQPKKSPVAFLGGSTLEDFLPRKQPLRRESARVTNLRISWPSAFITSKSSNPNPEISQQKQFWINHIFAF